VEGNISSRVEHLPVEIASRYTPRSVRSVIAKEMKPMISEAQITLSGTAIWEEVLGVYEISGRGQDDSEEQRNTPGMLGGKCKNFAREAPKMIPKNTVERASSSNENAADAP
jgi:hypothetical protein